MAAQTYSLDNIGRITQITENVLGQTKTYEYSYDLSGRLEQVFRNDTLISTYTYDDNGNRLSHISLSGTDNGVYDAQDRMLSYGNTTFGYNTRGSLTFKAENGDTTFYNYDMLGNLISVNLPNSDFIEYLIDAQNRRIGKKVNGVVERQWIYQDQLNPVAELDGSGNLIARFVYGDKGHVPAYVVKAGAVYRYVTDHLGSVRLVLNTSTGQVVQRLEYDEFGNVLLNSAPDFQPFAYAGGLYDVQTELVRFGARDYCAEVGRWTAKEPIGFFGSNNFYIYAHNNPINIIDINGLYATHIDYTNQRIYAEITNKGETLWELAENITGDGSRWTDIGDPCHEIDPRNIQIGDMFDVTGLFDPMMVEKMFYSANTDDMTKAEYYAGALLAMAGADITGIGVGIIATGVSGALVAGTGFVILGTGIVLISIDIIEGNGTDKTNQFLGIGN